MLWCSYAFAWSFSSFILPLLRHCGKQAAVFLCCCMCLKQQRSSTSSGRQAETFGYSCLCLKYQLSSTSSSQQPLWAWSAGTQELSLPALLQLLVSPSEQLRELQLALATAAGVPANAQVFDSTNLPVLNFTATDNASVPISGYSRAVRAG